MLSCAQNSAVSALTSNAVPLGKFHEVKWLGQRAQCPEAGHF